MKEKLFENTSGNQFVLAKEVEAPVASSNQSDVQNLELVKKYKWEQGKMFE